MNAAENTTARRSHIRKSSAGAGRGRPTRPIFRLRLPASSRSIRPSREDPPVPPDAIRKTTCYMCACRCGIDVHMEGTRVRHIEGNRDHPVNSGVLCAKGAAGIMQHLSPARLQGPLRRVGPRGSGEFREIPWSEALGIATNWLEPVREKHPERLAFFTGRDQSQALTGWWAQQFGTPNYAAHGGFCSVNMAAAGIYTMGGAFWEFGAPDWERTELLLLFGVAEDHDSNPLKINLAKLKARGARIVSVNPVRTGYSAIADQWIGITPGTDGLLILSLVHLLLSAGRVDLDYLLRWTNASHLVDRDPALARLRQHAAGRPRPPARLGSRAEARGAGRRAGAQARALRRLQHRPDLRQAGVPADRRDLPRPGARPGSGGTGLRLEPGTIRRLAAELGAGRLRARDHPRPPLDRLPRRAPRDDDRPAGGGARHARHLRPLERLPDLPRPAPLAAHPRHRRDPGRLPLRAALPEARRAAPEAAPQGHARLPARRPAARLPARPRGPRPRRRRPAEAHRQGLHLGGAARCPRHAAHGDRQRRRAATPTRSRCCSSTWPTWPGTRR